MKQKFFSLHTGMIYEVSQEEGALLDVSQIPLLGDPKSNCKKCYGRGFTDRDRITSVYTICNCLRKQIDWETYKKRTAK